NHLPTISDLPDRSINEDATLGPLSFTVGDLETSATALVTSGFCSNPALVPTNNFTFGGSGSNRTVTIVPAPNQFGSGTITIAVRDSDGHSGIDTFLLTVNPVNDPPTVGAPTALTINENAGLQTVTLTNITAGPSNEMQAVTFSVISSNPQLIPNPTVNYTKPSTVGVLQFTPVANASGVATLTLTANDGGASNNITTRQIVVTVNSVNEPVLDIVVRGTGATREAVLSWPVGFANGWKLETSPALGRAASWSTVTAARVVVNNRYTVTLPRGSANSFFRLRH
ncbi:MAG TPA: Ig-like domain-containing protein, partial [Verrucomicrobiae bacterium]|nr:Ig-like domain-containing protein [Verrucomicrobiae bacterium]